MPGPTYEAGMMTETKEHGLWVTPEAAYNINVGLLLTNMNQFRKQEGISFSANP